MNPRFFGDILGKFSFCDTYFSEQVATSQTIFQGFFTISPMSSLTNFRYGVFVNIGCAKDARLNVSRQMAKARWKGLYGRWKKNISAKNIALMTGTVVTILVDPPLKWNPTASIRGLSVAQMPKNHTIPASRILPSPFPPGPKSWRATRNSLKLQEFRKGDEIYGMTIETVVPWTSSKNPGPWCLYVTKRIHRWWCVNQLTVDQCSKKTVLQWLFSLWRLLCIHWLRIGMYDIDISYLIYVIGLQPAHEFRIPSLDTKTSRFMSWFPWWVLVEVEPAQLWYVVIQGCREKSDFMQLGRSGAFRGRRTSCTTQKEEMKDWGQWNRGFE